jgi:hypothetical protein
MYDSVQKNNMLSWVFVNVTQTQQNIKIVYAKLQTHMYTNSSIYSMHELACPFKRVIGVRSTLPV